jgi:hypothetical protein
MKSLFVLFVAFFSINSFSQEPEPQINFSAFKLGILGGMNFSTLSGVSFILEGKTNLNSNMYIKLSAGYSTLNKEEGYNVKTYRYVSFDNYQKYSTESYNVDKVNYDVFPISIGFEYIILKDNLSPYSVFEIGYNFYSYHTQISNGKSGFAGLYDTFDELPSEYKNPPPVISEDASYRIALGIGTNYKLNSAINLDVRYLYQFNKSLINTNMILVGITF